MFVSWGEFASQPFNGVNDTSENMVLLKGPLEIWSANALKWKHLGFHGPSFLELPSPPQFASRKAWPTKGLSQRALGPSNFPEPTSHLLISCNSIVPNDVANGSFSRVDLATLEHRGRPWISHVELRLWKALKSSDPFLLRNVQFSILIFSERQTNVPGPKPCSG